MDFDFCVPEGTPAEIEHLVKAENVTGNIYQQSTSVPPKAF